MAKVLSIIAPTDYQDKEYGDSKTALENAGHVVVTASTVKNANGAFGGSVKTDLLISEVNPSDYDAILFVGGGGCAAYFDDPVAHQLAKDFYSAGKITAAICAAPSILANAGLLNGVTCTSFPSQAENLKAHGAKYTGKPVEKEGLIITASGPMAAREFGEKIAGSLDHWITGSPFTGSQNHKNSLLKLKSKI